MKKMLTHEGYSALIEFDGEDEIFTGRILGINDIVGFHAETVAELKSAFTEAVGDYLATCQKLGKNPDKPFSGNLMLRVDPAVHSRAAIAAESAGKSLNQWGEEVLRKAAEEQIS